MKNIIFFITFITLLYSKANALPYTPTPGALVTEWVATDGKITINANTADYGYNYNLKWFLKSSPSIIIGTAPGVTTTYTINGLPNAITDTIVIEITGAYTQINLGSSDTLESRKLVDVAQWGDIEYLSFRFALLNCISIVSFTATDAPDLSRVSDMSFAFHGCKKFNGNINHWNVSSIDAMQATFYDCSVFNQPLNNWNVSNVKNLYNTFGWCLKFNQDLDNWDVSNVTNMMQTFQYCNQFNGNVDNWNVSNVVNMNGTFQHCHEFNRDISNWVLSNCTTTQYMFKQCYKFNQNINDWDVSKVTGMEAMFASAHAYRQDMDKWDVSKVTNMSYMFEDCPGYNGNITTWDVSSVVLFHYMFYHCNTFNRDLSSWNVGNGVHMEHMFEQCVNFNQDLSNWNTENVEYTHFMFSEAIKFNHDIGNWDVSKVKNFQNMFSYCYTFNQDLSNWDVSSGTNMRYMFFRCNVFTSDLKNWNVSNVTDMLAMFFDCYAFNADLRNWNVSNVSNMGEMFRYCGNFNQNLGNWNISNVTNITHMFQNTAIKYCYFDSTLIGWLQTGVKPGLNLGGTAASNPKHSIVSQNAINTLTSTHGWTAILSNEHILPIVTLSNTLPDCRGTEITLTKTGTALQPGETNQWFDQSGLIANNTSNTLNVVFDTYGTNNKYYINIIDILNCETPKDSVVITLTPPNTLASNNDSKICPVNTSSFVEFVKDNRALLAINSNGIDLGDVTVTTYVASAPISIQDCDNPAPWLSSYALQRHFVVKPTNTSATGSFNIRVYIDDSEFSTLASTSTTNINTNDNITNLANLKMTKYTGNFEDHLFDNNCGDGIFSIHSATTTGNISSIIPGFNTNGRYLEYTISSFSELWFHGSASNSPLPIELLNFEAKCEGNRVKVSWTTSSEQNNDFFIIEKSIDGFSWKKINQVQGHGNSNVLLHYEIGDQYSNKTQYYRLSQQDYDGTIVSYQPIAVKCENNSSNWNITAFPNPAVSESYLKIKSPESYNTNLTLYDVMGKKIQNENISIQEGEHDYPIMLNGSNGVYIISILDHENHEQKIKIIKSN